MSLHPENQASVEASNIYGLNVGDEILVQMQETGHTTVELSSYVQHTCAT